MRAREIVKPNNTIPSGSHDERPRKIERKNNTASPRLLYVYDDDTDPGVDCLPYDRGREKRGNVQTKQTHVVAGLLQKKPVLTASPMIVALKP